MPSGNHFPVDHSTDCPRNLSSPASLSVDQPGVYTRRASTVTPLRVNNPNLQRPGSKVLIGPCGRSSSQQYKARAFGYLRW
jgi:hypothetical protein